ncbi:hypothetical protein [Sinomicrobium oceani]|uniref:hypothetical protein n=1 Tax=Sinomicrobium oceani TaxID=1150368 RepID=UPI00093205A2|nr:hypothetical protein [Sinomicrobium oceani]
MLTLYAPEDQMQMVDHDAPGYYFHTFLLMAKDRLSSHTFLDGVLMKNIRPLRYGKTYKIQVFGMVELVVAAYRLKLLNFVVRLWNWQEGRENVVQSRTNGDE